MDREGEPEAGLQSGGPREDREQPELAVREAEDRDFPEEAVESLLTCRQALKITGLRGGRRKSCFQIVYFNLCHLSEQSFL